MRKVEDLTKEELCEIVQRMQELLYLDNDDGEEYFWNPDKEWDVDFLENIADTLQSYELVPAVHEQLK